MSELVAYRRIHIVGVAGSGMSGLAKMFSQAGHRVTGSDIKPAAVLRVLEGAGVETWVGHRPERAGEWDLVVASSAVPGEDPELVAASGAGVPVWARPQLLDALTARVQTVGVTGTHGKTTTTAMMVTAFHALGRDPSFLVGGEIIDLNTSAHLGQEPLLVLEADEAFGTFSGLDLAALAVTNIEADHLDHYRTLDALEAAFGAVAGRVAGPVVACIDDPGVRALMDALPSVVGYGTSKDATWRIEGIEHHRAAVTFTVVGPTGPVPVTVPTPGEHVARNATAVLALLGEMGLDVVAAAEGLSRYGGVRRRFEIKGVFRDTLVVDDYAHHPTEVAATIAAASLGHHGEVIAVFQPHRYTRTADIGHDLGRALAGADRVFVTDVYAAGEPPIPGVTGRLVAEAAAGAGATVEYVPARQDLAAAVYGTVQPGALVLLLGAGDITLVADELVVLLAES